MFRIPTVQDLLLRETAHGDTESAGFGAAGALQQDSGFGKEREIFFPRNPGGFEVIQNNEDGNGMVTRDYNGALDSGLGVNPVITLFPGQGKAGEFEDSAQRSIVNRRDTLAQEEKPAGLETDFTVFGSDQGGRNPLAAGADESFLRQDVFKGSHPVALLNEEADGLLEAPPGIVNGVTAAGDGEFGAETYEGLIFSEDEGSKLDSLHDNQTITQAGVPVKVVSEVSWETHL